MFVKIFDSYTQRALLRVFPAKVEPKILMCLYKNYGILSGKYPWLDSFIVKSTEQELLYFENICLLTVERFF